ncbi:MAG: leucine-rich repeat protein [candidate division SR1 bacterium]|nr:leucine-rich repeat protein [candidate division SR1 bacterium]
MDKGIKNISHVINHVKAHKHHYLLGTFGSFAIIKMVIVFLGLFGLSQIKHSFARSPAELNSGNIVGYGCATNDTICDLSNLQLTGIAPDTFINHTDLDSLYLSNNSLSSLDSGVFNNLTGLTHLYLSNNSGIILHTGIFDNLTSLIDLYLNSNSISSLPVGIFDSLTGLKNLDIAVNPGIILHTGIFDNLTSLSTLYLGSDSLSSLNSGVFNNLTGLHTLYLSNNSGIILHTGIFDNLTNLNVLDLSVNSLSSLPVGIFDNLTSLTQLYLNNNSGIILHTGIFDNLTSLSILNLYRDSLSSLPMGIFDNLTSLSLLNLGVNSLSPLNSGVFNNLTGLHSLYLNNNSLSSLNSGVFNNLTGLTHLDLSNNSLSFLHTGIFDNLTSLMDLYLNSNSISSLPVGIFNNLAGLTQLYLRTNSISSLPVGIFDNLTNLNVLDLGTNSLSSLPVGIFDNLTSLTQLYLNNNSISSLPQNITGLINLTTGVGLFISYNAIYTGYWNTDLLNFVNSKTNDPNRYSTQTWAPVVNGTVASGSSIVSGGYYNTTGITLTFDYTSLNYSHLSGLNDNTYYSGTFANGATITGQGTYIFMVMDNNGFSGSIVFTIDRIAPSFTGTTQVGGHVSTGGRYTTGITITFYDTNISGATLNGNPYTSGTLISDNGEYVFLVEDLASNFTGMTFTIDTTPPTLTGVVRGVYYNTSRTITGSDDFAFSGFLLSGTFHTGSSLTVTGNGTRMITGYDFAGNYSTGITFIIDRTLPIFTGTTQSGTIIHTGGRYNTGIRITFYDTNISGATLNGSAYTSGTLITGNGNYTFLVGDLANNSTGISFTIDTTPPTITAVTLTGDDVSSGGYYNTGVSFSSATVDFSGIILSGLNGNSYYNLSFSNSVTVTGEGTYRGTIYDAAGNSSSMIFTIDTTLPSFTGTTQGGTIVHTGGYYTTGIRITFYDTNISGAAIFHTAYTSGTLLTGAQVYRFTVTDLANNSTGMTFTIDTTRPTLTGVTSGTYHNTGVTISGSDDFAFSGFLLSGTFHAGSSLTVTGNGTRTITGYDFAGNYSTGISFIIDTIAPTLTGATSGTSYNTGVTISGSDNTLFSGFLLSGTFYSGSSLTVTGNGTRTITGYDFAGNYSTGITFIIDRTLPIFTGTTQSDINIISGGYYSTGITITFTGTNISGATLNGTGYTSGTLITGDGAYIFLVTNTFNSSTGMSFTIDTIAPTITGANSETYYTGNVTIVGTDAVGFSGFDLSGTFYTGTSITITGDGIRTITGYDRAGNYSDSITFTIDATAPTFEGTTQSGTNVISGGYYNTGVTITFDDIHFSGATLNGTGYIGATLITGNGAYILFVSDIFNNSTGMTFTIDTTNPLVTGNYPTSGLNISGGNLINFLRSGTDTNISGYTLYITGAQSNTVITTGTSSGVWLINGDYSWYVLATDRAGNTGVSETLSFNITTPLSGTVTLTGTNIKYNTNPYTKDYVSLLFQPNQPCDYSMTGDIILGTISGSTSNAVTISPYLTGNDGIKHIYLSFSNASGAVVSNTITIYLDTTVNGPTLTSPTSGATLTGATLTGAFSLAWAASGTDAVGLSGYQYFISTTGTFATLVLSGTTTGTSTGIAYNRLGSTGTFYWYVKALDVLGNSGSSVVQSFYYSGIADTIPDTFTFASVTNATINRVYGSNTVTLTGLSPNTSVLASINRGVLYISGHVVGTTGYVQNGWTIKIELISSVDYNTLITSTLTIGGVATLFRVTTAASTGASYGDITTNLSNTEKIQIIAVFETLRDLYAGTKQDEFLNSLMVMLLSKIHALGTTADDIHRSEVLQYLYDLADQYRTNQGSNTTIEGTSRIINGVYTAPNGKHYTITYNSAKAQFTSTNFITPKYFPTLDVLKYTIDLSNPAGSSYLAAKTIRARWGRISIDGTRQTSPFTAPNHKVFYFFKTTGGKYSSYTFTTEKYFDTLELAKENIHNNNLR